MASSLLALFSLLFFFTAIPFPAAASLDDVVSSICPKTRNPTFCSSVVHSAATADLKILAAYTLNLAHTNAGDTLSLARSLAATTADPQLKQRYSSCSSSYSGAFTHIEQAQKLLVDGAYDDVSDLTSGVVATVDDCQNKFKQPPADPSALTKNGKTLEDLCSIVLVLTGLLPGVQTDGTHLK